MRILVNRKNEKTCDRCDGHIKRGEIYVLASYISKITQRWYSNNYHYECYKEVVIERMDNKFMEFSQMLTPPKRPGRKPIHDNPVLVNRVKSLISYHRRAGNMQRVEEIRREYGDLRI